MNTEEIIRQMRSLIKSREEVMASIRRKRWRPSEKAMALADHQAHIDALKATILMLSGPQFEGVTVDPDKKESSPEMSTLAGQMMARCREMRKSPELFRNAVNGDYRVPPEFITNVMRLCGSVISQDETPGQRGAQEHSDVLRAAGVPSEGDGQEHSAIMDAIRGG